MQIPFIVLVLALLSAAFAQKDARCVNGVPATVGDTVGVHYSGYIDKSSAAGEHGKMFDSSLKRGPFTFRLGSGQVIKGWDQGIDGMCLGEKKTLTIPPELGYGARGAGKDIPPNATLRFTVDLISINDNKIALEPTAEPNIFREMDTNNDQHITEEEMQAWFTSTHPDKLTSIPQGLFEREDKNGDKVISWEEFDGPKGDSA
eukprot:gene29661-33491_t